MRTKPGLSLFFCLLLSSLGALRGQQQAELVSSLLTGAWQEESDGELLQFEPDRALVYQQGRLAVRGVEVYEGSTARVRVSGLLQTWCFSLEHDRLRLEVAGKARSYRHLKSPPPELALKPLPLGKQVEISGDRVKQIQEELAQRIKTDQAVRKDPARRKEMPSVGADNTNYVRALVQELGWIDIRRFGELASGNAIILVQHSLDLPLMLSVLPEIERDFKPRGPDALLFAIVYDRLENELGRKQRFGTQLGEDAQGQPMFIPLESVDKVDEFRKELGLPPLAEYLALASKVLYDGKPIRLPRVDE
jgi:hypothetical protein